MRTLTVDGNVEVIGASMLSIIDNMQSDEIAPYLEKHDLTEIGPDQWYPAQLWLDVMNDLAKRPNMSSNLIAIGMQIAENVVLPPGLEDAPLPMILEKWDAIYHNQHRGGEIGSRLIEKVSDTHYRCVLTGIYPDDLAYGVVYGFCRRFLPTTAEFMVSYEDSDYRRDKGDAPATVIVVDWSE